MVKVLLTGGNGFIAAHILNLLLSRNDDVVVTVRSKQLGEKILEKHQSVTPQQLQYVIVEDITAAGAMDKVRFFEKALIFADSLDKVFVSHINLDYVLHTASPFTPKWADAVKEILDPAVKGTLETLRSIKAHAPRVKRVVLLSSFVTFMNPGAEIQVYDESMWNPVTWDAAVTDRRLTYTGSKTLAERAAWDFVRYDRPNFDLVSLNPPLVFGPIAHHLPNLDSLNTSNQRVLAMVRGAFRDTTLPPTGIFLWVDVRDVALAHIRAIETTAAGGERIMLIGGHFSNKTLADAIADTHSDISPKLPLNAKDDTPASVYQYNGVKATGILGIDFRTFRDCIADTVSSLEAAA